MQTGDPSQNCVIFRDIAVCPVMVMVILHGQGTFECQERCSLHLNTNPKMFPAL